MRIAFFGSSLVSAYWNGAATYYRGIIHALYDLGHEITFYEPDAFDRQQHRDMDDPPWAAVHVYSNCIDSVMTALEEARNSDLLIKASGVGVFDNFLERELPNAARNDALKIFWDVDAPATLDRMNMNVLDPLREVLPRYDLVLTYGGGWPVISAYRRMGARDCVPIYNGLDPATHFPVPPDPRYKGDVAFLGNRLPDREARVDEFFFKPANMRPKRQFILGGNGWQNRPMPPNVNYVGHTYTADHNAFNSTPMAVLNIHRDSMASYGFSPATRVFEAAGAAACLISDAFQGVEEFLEPDSEILIAENSDGVLAHIDSLTPDRARRIGRAARERIIARHTYRHRAAQLNALLGVAHSAAAATSLA